MSYQAVYKNARIYTDKEAEGAFRNNEHCNTIPEKLSVSCR
jgi:hypothetical protein